MAYKFLQYKGPYQSGDQIELPSNNGVVKLGVSIGQKDFMKNGFVDNEYYPENRIKIQLEQFQTNGISITKNIQIQIGKTYIYEPGVKINLSKIIFPNGAPTSTLVDIVFTTDDIDNQALLVTEGD